MTKIQRSNSEFETKFYEQLALLLAACRNYDEGLGIAALDIAVRLRTLFYDKGTSISALTHINKRNIDMLDSSTYTGDDLNLGLVLKQFSKPFKKKYTIPDTENHKLTYIPFCHSIESFEKWKTAKKRWVNIDDWLNQEICSNKKIPEAKLSRLDFIKITADRDGGAHIDKSVDVSYDHFRFKDKGLNERDIQEWQDRKILNVPIYPILRQVAFEALFGFRQAGLLDVNAPLVWKQDFNVLKTSLKTVQIENDQLKQITGKIRLRGPSELNPNSSEEPEEDDEFSVGTIKM